MENIKVSKCVYKIIRGDFTKSNQLDGNMPTRVRIIEWLYDLKFLGISLCNSCESKSLSVFTFLYRMIVLAVILL